MMLSVLDAVQEVRLSKQATEKFQNFIWRFYQLQKREFPWRNTVDPYRIWISEIMLQQTQTERVVPKYKAFLNRFPAVEDLARARLPEVLQLWVGLGYNRRAKFLHQSAQQIVEHLGGTFPGEVSELEKLPGIGNYTARAVATFAYNQRLVFIETNIRTVFLYHFFPEHEKVSDDVIMSLVDQTLPQTNSRDWYYALMDYGAWLKKQVGNANVRSKHYAKQSRFEGSIRQVRGAIIRELSSGEKNWNELRLQIPQNRHDVDKIVQSLVKEGMVQWEDEVLKLAE